MIEKDLKLLRWFINDHLGERSRTIETEVLKALDNVEKELMSPERPSSLDHDRVFQKACNAVSSIGDYGRNR